MSVDRGPRMSILLPVRKGAHRRPRPSPLRPLLHILLLLALVAGTMAAWAAAASASGGDFHLVYVAAKPGTYDQSTGTGGVYGTGGPDTTVTSLEGGDFACGDIVQFLTAVQVDPGATGTQTIDINYFFNAVTTSGGQVGFGNIIYADLNPNDPGNLNLNGNETVSLVAENDGATVTTGTVRVGGLDAGEQVIVSMGVQIVCNVSPSKVTGNILTGITSAATFPEGDAINVGNQTVPLKSAGQIAAPGITITKSCTPTVHVGDTIDYSITITNTGNETLNIDSVTDSVLGDITSSFPSTLAAGASDTETFTHTATLSDGTSLTNTVTVNATGAISGVSASATASCTTAIAFTSGISVEKSCSPSVPVGGTVDYSITVTNTGEDVLNNITVNDTLLGDLSSSFPDSLDPGQSDTETFSRQQQAGDPDPIVNTVTAEADGAFSGDHVTDTANCATDVTHVPGIAVEKTCPAKALVGDKLVYTITITNTGNEPLTNITVIDSIAGDVSDQFADTLDVGASETETITHTATTADVGNLENDVTASGTGADSTVTAKAATGCSTAVKAPAIAFTGSDVGGRGLSTLLLLLAGGLGFLLLGRQPQLAFAGSHRMSRRGAHAAQGRGLAWITLVAPHRGAHRKRH